MHIFGGISHWSPENSSLPYMPCCVRYSWLFLICRAMEGVLDSTLYAVLCKVSLTLPICRLWKVSLTCVLLQVAKSRDVEVLEGKTQYLEFAGNLVPITKSGDQLAFNFYAFRENRLPFTVRVKDLHAEPVGRVAFMRQPKVMRSHPVGLFNYLIIMMTIMIIIL